MSLGIFKSTISNWNREQCLSRCPSGLEQFPNHGYVFVVYKLNQNSISGSLWSTLTGSLKLRKQKVVLNVQLSSWSNIYFIR